MRYMYVHVQHVPVRSTRHADQRKRLKMTASSNPTDPYNGVKRMRGSMACGFVLLTLVYFGVLHLLRDSSSYLPPGDEYCREGSDTDPCSRPDLFAFQVSSGTAIFYVGWLGFHTWYISKRVHIALPNTPAGRLFGYLEESEKIAAANFSFQLWDFIISLFIPEHCTAVFLTHHVMAAIVSWFSLSSQMLHYYGIYFLGLTEVSSCFLVLIDLGRYFPPSPGSAFGYLVAICQPAFLVTFGLYRIILWWKVSYLLWTDVLHVVTTGTADELRPGRAYLLKFIYLPFNVLLGFLQLHWFTFILGETKKVVFGNIVPTHAQGTE